MRRINDDKHSTKRSDGDQRTPGTKKLAVQRQTLRELSIPNLEIAQGGRGCSISHDNDI